MPRLLLRRPSRRQVPARVASPSTKKSSGRSGFYWHFADRAELIAATLELWEQLATTETIDRIQSIPDPRERLTALAAGAYAGAARGNAYAAVLAAVSDPRIQNVLERVTRTPSWPSLKGSTLGLTGRPKQLATPAWPTHLYLGISELRHADLDSGSTGQELDASLKLAVDIIMPPHRAA